MSAGPTAPAFGILSAPMSAAQSGILPAGTPVYPGVSGGDGKLLPARANNIDTVDSVVGLLVHPATADQEAKFQFGGPLTLTTDQWDTVTGQTGGLTPGARYFVSSATAGKLTSTKPTAGGTLQFQVGVALSANILGLQLGGPGTLL